MPNQSSSSRFDDKRRSFLWSAASLATVAVAACMGKAEAGSHPEEEDEEAEVTPAEDLMQEHGLLERVLLIYDEAAARIEQGTALDVSIVGRAASIVRRFVEDYHEKLEEQFVFPRLESAHREVDLVGTLRHQHERGRVVTADIVRWSQGKATPDLSKSLRSFIRMYRPHAAREETVLFPAFRRTIGRKAYRELGERFEEEEHRRFGKGGFEKNVGEVATLEQALGIADLSKFTA